MDKDGAMHTLKEPNRKSRQIFITYVFMEIKTFVAIQITSYREMFGNQLELCLAVTSNFVTEILLRIAFWS